MVFSECQSHLIGKAEVVPGTYTSSANWYRYLALKHAFSCPYILYKGEGKECRKYD